ncbi:MAG: APC family permease [Clostridia bacterium]|nr:APC family permease [Clostridia bacterium]
MDQNNNGHLHKKYGLPTAISMVVGTVIGSGVFFKASKVLASNNGSMIKSIITVASVGVIMLVCAYVFSLLAARVDKVNGLVDYSEISCGKFYAYSVGWFASTIFYPTITACLGWISANYIIILFGIDLGWWFHYLLAAALLILSFFFNIISPKLSGKFQVSTTAIKLVPLAVMAIAGTLIGLINGTTVTNLTSTHSSITGGDGLFASIVAFAFAYEGWIFATTINSEIKDSKKNLPKALFLGSIIIITVYLFYFLGLMGVLSVEEIVSAGDDLARVAFSSLFGSPIFGTIIYAFVVVSCIGTMNGLMLASTRGMYSIAARGDGIAPSLFSKIDKRTDMPIYSAIFGLGTCLIWLTQWQIGFINGYLPEFMSFENDELPIVTFYIACVPIFIYVMRKCKDLGVIKRFVIPSLACLSCGFMVFCAIYSYRLDALYYLGFFVVIMAAGMPFYRGSKKQ